jgi:hypothetical protein
VRTFCLRTVYETKNLGFYDEGVLRTGTIGAHLTRQCKLPEATFRIDGVESNGKKRVIVTTVDRTYRGQPLLLEIIATKNTEDAVNAAIVRPDLEFQTADLAAMLTWCLPGTVGTPLANALFSRSPADPQDEWTWDDVSEITVEGYFPALPDLKSRFDSTEQSIRSHSTCPAEVLSTAMKWWRHGLAAGEPVDRFIAYWIVLETTSAEMSTEDSIAARVKETLDRLFPTLAQVDSGQKSKRLKDVLYRARCKAVHSGRRELPEIQSLVQLSRTIASACILHLIDGSVSGPPEADLLATLGI